MRRALAPLAALALVLGACGNDDDAPDLDLGDDPVVTDPADPEDGAPEAPADGDATVSVEDLAYQPGVLDTTAGTTVTWTNQDQVPHTVTATDGPGDFDESLPAGESVSVTFDEPGTYDYTCTIHPTMTGTVEVS